MAQGDLGGKEKEREDVGLFGAPRLPSNSLSPFTLVGKHPCGAALCLGDGVCALQHPSSSAQGWVSLLDAVPLAASPHAPAATSCTPKRGSPASSERCAGQSRVSGTDASLGLSLAVTHLFSSEGRARGNSPQPKYRAGLPGASDVLWCRKAIRVAGNLPREMLENHKEVREPASAAVCHSRWCREQVWGAAGQPARAALRDRGCQRAAAALTTPLAWAAHAIVSYSPPQCPPPWRRASSVL